MIENENWKMKCKELYDVCKNLVEENTDLLGKIKVLKEGGKTASSVSRSKERTSTPSVVN
jgi:hypothetical protein